MEFSETFELKRLVNSKNHFQDQSPLTRILRSGQYSFSKTCSSNISGFRSLSEDVSTCDYLGCCSEGTLDVKIEPDMTYLMAAKGARTSFLTLQLTRQQSLTKVTQDNLQVVIYFFSTDFHLNLTVPIEINARDLIIKAILAYEKHSTLPSNVDEDCYDLWIAEDDSFLPDFDYKIESSHQIASLNTSRFCLLAKENCSKFNSSSSSLLKRLQNPQNFFIKFFFDKSSTVLLINSDQLLGEVLPSLWKKFHISESLTFDSVVLKVLVKETGSECELDLGLKFREVEQKEFRLCRKTLADDPR